MPRAAAADDYSLHVQGNLQTSWTDNLFSRPDGDAQQVADVFTQIRPGALFAYETPRTIFQVGYDLDTSLYADVSGKNNEAYSLTHLATARGFFLTSPRTEMQVGGSFSAGSNLALIATTSQPGTGVQVGQAGENSFWSADASQSLSFTATQEMRLSQGARVRKFSTTADLGTMSATSGGSEVGLNVGADRGWKHTAIALQLSSAFVTLDQAASTIETINSNIVLSYRRDISPRWSALLDGGGAAVFPLGDDPMDQIFIQPTVGTNISYAPNWGAAGLMLRRSMAPNFYTGRNQISDSATLNASLPLPWLTDDPNLPTLTAAGGGGVSRSQQIENGVLTQATDMVSVDIALQYNPRPGLGFALRAQHLRQIAEDGGGGAGVLTDYDRTTIMVSANWRFPDRVAAEIPMRDSLRVDRSDNTPVGEEVAPAVAPQ